LFPFQVIFTVPRNNPESPVLGLAKPCMPIAPSPKTPVPRLALVMP
jgi:hypothetical protein